MEGVTLKDRFNHIFEFSDNKMATVAEIVRLGWGESGETWKWRRPLRAWEEEKSGEYSACLNSIILQDDVTDMWRWNLHTSKSYNVSNVYNFLQQTTTQHINQDDFHVFLVQRCPLSK